MASRSYNTVLDRPLPHRVKIVLSAIVVAVALWVGTNSGFCNTSALNPFLAYSLAGFALIYARLRPKWLDVAFIVGLTTVLAWIDAKVLRYALDFYAVLGILGVVSIAAIAVRGIWSINVERKRLLLAFAFAILSVGSNGIAGVVHNWVAQLTPKVFDLSLCAFDGSLGIQPSFLMGQVYAKWHWFGHTGGFFYVAFPLTIALVFVGQLIRDRKEVAAAMTAFLITGPVGVIFYGLYPALGPLYVFRDRFPWNPLTIDQLSRLRLDTLELPGYRNSMPSLHIAWVLLALWYSRGLSGWERLIAVLFMVFTAFATLGSGEHYLIDLVVACPFALFIYGLSAANVSWAYSARRVAVLSGLAMTLLWIELLRFNVKMFWISSAIPWVACIATVVLACVLQQRLVRAAAGAIKVELSAPATAAPIVSS